MCVIVDANLAASVFANPRLADFAPLLDWLFDPDKDGRLIYGGHLETELERVGDARRAVKSLWQSGRAHQIKDSRVSTVIAQLSAGRLCRSNDHHVVALALVSGARVLCTRDRALHEDFTNKDIVKQPRGKIYQGRDHAHLLVHSSSCGLLGTRGKAAVRAAQAKRHLKRRN